MTIATNLRQVSDSEALAAFSAWALSRADLGRRPFPLADGFPLRAGVHVLVRHAPLERAMKQAGAL